MSYSHHVGIATCTVKNVLDVNDLISHVYDYLTNHEDEAPTGLLDCSSFEEFADTLEPYVQLSEDTLTIKVDTEECNCDGEIFDFMVSHYVHLMTSKVMQVIWVTQDSRDGLSGDCYYYDENNELIDVNKLLTSC